MTRTLLRRTLAILAMAALSAGALHAQGKLEIVGGDTHDWGNVSPGKLTAVVKLKNIGTGDLNILEVRPTCLCTIAPIDRNLLKPGEIAQIDITLDATGKSGLVERNIIIRTSDSSSAQQVLHLKATVRRDIIIAPSSYFIVKDAKPNVETEAEMITIINGSDTTITIYPPGAPQGAVKVRYDMTTPRQLKPGEQFALRAFVTPLAASGISGSVKIRTTSLQMPYLDVALTGTMAGSDAGGPSR